MLEDWKLETEAKSWRRKTVSKSFRVGRGASSFKTGTRVFDTITPVTYVRIQNQWIEIEWTYNDEDISSVPSSRVRSATTSKASSDSLPSPLPEEVKRKGAVLGFTKRKSAWIPTIRSCTVDVVFLGLLFRRFPCSRTS